MKASELRIGNYVRLEDMCGFNFHVLDEVPKQEDELYRWIEPIPLTEEWLLKFGFEVEYSQLTNVYKYFLVNTPFGYCQGQFNVFTQTGCFSVEIKYVHQLQNLYFALTNEELTYEQQK